MMKRVMGVILMISAVVLFFYVGGILHLVNGLQGFFEEIQTGRNGLQIFLQLLKAFVGTPTIAYYSFILGRIGVMLFRE